MGGCGLCGEVDIKALSVFEVELFLKSSFLYFCSRFVGGWRWCGRVDINDITAEVEVGFVNFLNISEV